jgi:hypothetical protein
MGVGVHFVPSYVQSPPVTTTAPTPKISWFHEHIDVAQTFICNSVRPGTKRTYSTGEQRWLVVAEQIGTDSLMRIVPDVWARRTDSMRDSSLTWPEACMLAFLTSCRDVGQAVSPKTAFVYLSAVRKYFQINGVDVTFLKDSHYIQKY